jgi:23S rRNA maturation mini-RNase III
MAIRYVSARGQAMMLRGLLDEHNAESENMILPFDDETKCAASSTTDERDVDFEQTGSDDVPLDNEIDFALSGISNANNMDNRYVDVSVDEGIRCASSYPEENAFIFSGRELNLMRRARNHHTDSQPKNVDIRDYHLATAFETLIGWLWLTDQKNRAFHLIDRALAIADDHPNDE